MFRIIGVFLLFLGSVFGLEPSYQLKMENNIIDVNYVENRLLVGTDFGEVIEVKFEKEFKNITKKVVLKLPDISNFFGDFYPPKVFSVDFLEGRLLVNSEGSEGTKNLFVFKDQLEKLPIALNIKKAAFVDKDKIFLGLMSNEILLYDLKDSKILYQKQLSEATFSDFTLSEDKKYFLVSCESGILYYGKTLNGEILKEFSGLNKDNVYEAKMGFQGSDIVIIAAGQDRRVGVYFGNRMQDYTKEADFLVYSVGLSLDGKTGAYMKNEMSDIAVFEINGGKEMAILKGHKNLLNSIIFIDDKNIVSAEDGKNILFWKLP
ncbi:nitrate reductase [Helicobacter pullorum]|uniref:Periplasmic nitrate reductase component NapL n=1 Tax=Helicobacter pullorum TaxID=35818 RepID=A0A377PY25_9HELI|nr:nitrate reductase [Helicobacter pullorum]STQ87878.1 periplasmic nitrate reductase component NapL [Helicobacter pullorum]